MVSFLFLMPLVLTGMAIASPLELRMENKLEKRTTMLYCDDNSLTQTIVNVHTEALSLAKGAIDYINSHGITDELFTTYFGTVQDSTTQLNYFTAAANEDSLTLYCHDYGQVCTNNTSIGDFGAYNDGTDVYFCSSFYDNQAPASQLCLGMTVDSGSVRSGTMLHEILRALSQVGDYGDGCANARSIASTQPYAAVDNADNYSCFALAVFDKTQCLT